jgi:hypothetical protein
MVNACMKITYISTPFAIRHLGSTIAVLIEASRYSMPHYHLRYCRGVFPSYAFLVIVILTSGPSSSPSRVTWLEISTEAFLDFRPLSAPERAILSSAPPGLCSLEFSS